MIVRFLVSFHARVCVSLSVIASVKASVRAFALVPMSVYDSLCVFLIVCVRVFVRVCLLRV